MFRQLKLTQTMELSHPEFITFGWVSSLQYTFNINCYLAMSTYWQSEPVGSSTPMKSPDRATSEGLVSQKSIAHES